MHRKNVLELAEETTINARYDIGCKDITTIYDTYKNDPFMLIRTSFKLGYLLGGRAEKAKERRCK